MLDQKQDQINSYLSFHVGNEIFAASVSNVVNILEMTKITRVPKSASYMKGVINLRGIVLPVLDTRIKFGLAETEYTTNTCILVMELISKNEMFQLGIIVDSVQEVLELEAKDILPPPKLGTNYSSDFLKGMARKEDNFIMIINVEKVFSVDEIINIQDITPEVNIAG